MKNLSYQVKGNQVVFKLIENTISYYTTSELVSQKLIDYVMESVTNYKRVLSEINEGDEWFFIEQFHVYNEKGDVLLVFDIDKGRKLNPLQKEAVVAEINLSIKEQKQFTGLSLFEMRVNDLEIVLYSYITDDIEVTNIYIYQIYQKQYIRA